VAPLARPKLELAAWVELPALAELSAAPAAQVEQGPAARLAPRGRAARAAVVE
jgi:hypothetical protein